MEMYYDAGEYELFKGANRFLESRDRKNNDKNEF
jgi:hypothetical protein